MTYSDALSFFRSLSPRGISLGLERISKLCHLLGNPQDTMKFVHVAGTNGKGSVSAMIANVLYYGGFRTGLFTSPPVIDYREQVKINGRMISECDFSLLAESVSPAVSALEKDGICVTEFEALTALAFLYFHRSNCDIAVLEAGLGGKDDSTNVIIDPLVSVLTSISLDHTDILGGALEDIARNKCGIIKENGIVVSYPDQPPEVAKIIREYAQAKSARLLIPDGSEYTILSSNINGSVIKSGTSKYESSKCGASKYGPQEFEIPLIGAHFAKNAFTAIEAIHALRGIGYDIPDESVRDGLGNIKMPARMEVIKKSPFVIVDGGHNPGCASALLEAASSLFADKKIIAVCAMMSNKDYRSYVGILAPRISHLVATTVPMERALPAELLFEASQSAGIDSECVPDCFEAMKSALALASPDDAVIICGSFYLAERARKTGDGSLS